MDKFRKFDTRGHAVVPAGAYPVLPAIKARLFHVRKPISRWCLVDAGEHLEPGVTGPQPSEDDAYYEVRLVKPPATLTQWVKNGAKLGLSAPGSVRVWLSGKIVAAESDADCQVHGVRKLVEEDIFYATVFLFSIGQRWSDPGQGEA